MCFADTSSPPPIQSAPPARLEAEPQYAPPPGPPPAQMTGDPRPPAVPQRRESQPQADDLEDVKKVCVYWPSLSILTVSPVALCNGFPSVTRNQSPRRKRLRLPEGAQRAPCAMIRSSRCGQEWAKGVMWKAEGLLDELISQNVECIMIAFLLSKQSPLEHLSRGQSAHRYVEVFSTGIDNPVLVRP